MRLIAVLVLLAAPASALDPTAAITQYGHTAWRVREGHFAAAPTSIAQTSDGFLWIGTEAGLLRFDGVGFERWRPREPQGLPDERIFSLLGASDGSLWIGTGLGLAQLKDGTLVVHARVGRFLALVEDHDGTIWAGHTRALAELPGLCRVDGVALTCVDPGGGLAYVSALYVDGAGGVWVGGGGGVCRWGSGAPVCHPIASLGGVAERYGVTAIGEDSRGVIHAATSPSGIWRLAATGWAAVTPFSEVSGEPAILVDRSGALWVGGKESGLKRSAEGRHDRFDARDGLSGDEVNQLFEDREGNVWVATSSGIDRFRDVKVRTFTRREGLSGHTVLAVAASKDGSLWLSEARSLTRLESGAFTFFAKADGLPGTGPTSLFEDSRGRLWLGVDNGLAWRERGRFSRVMMPDGSPVGIVRDMVEDRDGSLWAAVNGRRATLVRVRDGRVVEEFPRERFGELVSALHAAVDGGVWLGLADRGPALLRNGVVHPWAGHGRPFGVEARGLLVDPRGVWMATERGLFRFAGSRVDTLRGLPCSDVESVVLDGDGALWVKAACGLIRIADVALEGWMADPEQAVPTTVLDIFDGAQAGVPAFAPRATRTTDGRLWFAVARGGLQSIDPRRLGGNPLPPPVHVTRVAADGQSLDAGKPLHLRPLTKDVEIDYTALSLAVPEKVRFRYRLEGEDPEWRDAGTRRQAYYSNLRPGHYRFRVLASNNDGVWNEEGSAVEFSVAPAFHQTNGFLAACVLTAGLVGWCAYRWRLRQVTARLDLQFDQRLAERTRVAQDLHDTILQGCISASMHVHMVHDGTPGDSPLKPLAARAVEVMEAVIVEGRDTLRGLRTLDAAADALDAAFSRIPRELGVDGTVGYQVLVSGRPRRLRPAVRDEIHRIGREAVVNAFRHARPTTIEVEIVYAAAALALVVRDDGSGIPSELVESGRAGHWGLTGMQERTREIGARLRVWSRPAGGTEVELLVPARLAFVPDGTERHGWLAFWRRLRGARGSSVLHGKP